MTSNSSGPAGPSTWRIVAAFGLVLVLAVALVLVVSRPPEPSAAGPAGTTAATLGPAPTLAPPVTTTSPPTPAASPAAPTSTSAAASPTGMPSTTTPVPAAGRLRRDLEAAFASWGAFAVSGDVELLDGTFDTGGPQYARLLSEVPGIVESAGENADPYVFTLSAPVVIERGGGIAVIRTDVEGMQSGERTVAATWDVELRRAPDGAWLLWTTSSVG